MQRPFYEIGPHDVGKATLHMFGGMVPADAFIGRVLPCDVGKRVYAVATIGGDYTLQVENDSQRAARLAKEPGA
jgi:hypothetical protein